MKTLNIKIFTLFSFSVFLLLACVTFLSLPHITTAEDADPDGGTDVTVDVDCVNGAQTITLTDTTTGESVTVSFDGDGNITSFE